MTVEELSPYLGRPVAVGDIDRELKKLWEEDEASTNASLMNFLVYTEDPKRLIENAKVVPAISREHACRAVLIGMEREAAEAKVDSWINANCHLAHGKKSICSEQVSFLLRGKALGRLRNTVFAHLNSDLPLVFWWQGEFSNLFDERLYRILDRLIFDSSEWENPTENFDKLLAARADTGCQMVTQDLSWTRSFHFRLALAALMDDPTAQEAFPNVTRLKISGNRKYHMAVKLLVAWVVEMAGWSRGLEGFRSAEGKDISLEVEWLTDSAPIAELKLEAPNFSATVTREKGGTHLYQTLCVGDHCVRASSPADADTPAELVASQLSRGGKNSLFLRVLPKFLELL